MTTKSPGKTEPAAQSTAGIRNEETKAAYLAHTLAHMLYGHLAATHPWLATNPYQAQATPYTMPNVPYTMFNMPYVMPNVPYSPLNTAFATPNTPYTTLSMPYAMPNVAPQPPYGIQNSMSWSPFYPAYCGCVPGQVR